MCVVYVWYGLECCGDVCMYVVVLVVCWIIEYYVECYDIVVDCDVVYVFVCCVWVVGIGVDDCC